jgi:signal peptidase
MEYTYSKSNFAVAYKDKKRNVIATAVLTVVMSLMIALISCRFRYGVLVVGSGSMTGSINLGDAVVYESYHNQEVEKNDIIIFYKENVKLVHRIVSIEELNGEVRYYTKGDANTNVDNGYITKDNIIGTTIFKIKYIGYPTLWLRDIFS